VIGVLPLLVVVLIVVAVVVALRSGRHPAGAADGGAAGGVRRVFTLLLLAGGVGFAASGISSLVAILLPGEVLAGEIDTRLASGLSSTLVGLPLAVVMARSVRRRIVADPGERRSVSWPAYLTGMSVLAAGFSLAGAAELLGSLGAGRSVPGTAAGNLVAWSVVWWLHRRAARDPGLAPLTGPNAAVAAESTLGLLVAAGGGGALLATVLTGAYERLTERISVGDARSTLAETGAALVAGGVAWTFTWLLDGARRRPRTIGLQTYELSVGVLGGLVATMTATATALFLAVEWALGQPEATSAAAQFAPLPPALAAAVVGALVWWYHRRSAGAADIDAAAERAYRYLAAAIGLGAAAVGVGILVSAFFSSFAPVLAGASTVDVVLGGVTTLVVGAPFWWANWRFVERAAAARPEAERASGARRIYLLGVLGVTGAAAAGAAVALLTSLIRGLLGGDAAGEILGGLAVPAGILLSAGAVAGTHGRIWREERAAAAPTGPRVVTVIGEDVDALADAIRANGPHVVAYRRGAAVPVDGGVAAALASLSSPEAVVVVEDGAIVVYPVERV